MSDNLSFARFPTTCWTQVTQAGNPADPAASDALGVLCAAYWYPLYAFVRRQGFGPHDAADLVQGFFADLIERRDLAIVNRNRGRFRSFLRAACGHYVAHQRIRSAALRRGGGRQPIAFDVTDAEGRYGREPAHELTAERLFERRWALNLMEHVVDRLEHEWAQAGKAELYTRLRPTLEGDGRAETYRGVAESLGLSEGAVKMAAHRLRARYRELLREEVARTVSDPTEVDAELGELLAALAG